MSDIAAQFNTMLIKSGFQEMPPNGKFSSVGNFYCLPESFGEGIYWIYGEKNLFNIKIHDFYFYEDEFFDQESLNWPESLSITYYESVSGEEIMPYRRLTAGCIKTFFGGQHPYKAIFHKNIPIRTIGIEIMPAYYEKYLKEAFPDEYINPDEAFREIDQTNNFPEMVSLLRKVWNYNGDGMAAKLFFQSKVFEAVALIVEHNKKSPEKEKVRISSQDIKSLENVAAYINDHYNRKILLDKLARIACMGTTKLKITFKQVYCCTITEYIQQRRLSQGENLLCSTDFSIEQIALAVGYSNAGRFSRDFKKSTGLYPSEYRKWAQQKKINKNDITNHSV